MRSNVKKLFVEELKKGTGKAVLLFKQHYKGHDFQRQLIEAAVHNPDYDPQCSGSRATYLYEMIKLHPKCRDIESEILKRFLRTYWCSVDQLFDLAVLFTKNENESARKAIYRKFKDELGSPDGAGAGSWQIVEMDGIKGFLIVAEFRGRQLLKDKEEWEDHTLFDYAQKRLPKKNLMVVLETNAVKNKSVRAYLRAVKHSKMKAKNYKKKTLSYQQVKKLIASGGKIPMFWGANASQKDFEAIARDFIKETNNKRIITYLRIFGKKRFPLDLRYLLDWKRYKTNKMKQWALMALSHFQNEEVRRIAVSYLKQRKMSSWAFEVFIKNFKEEDVPCIEKVLWQENDPDEFHGAAMPVIDICNAKKTKRPMRLLKLIYKRGYCAGCRWRVIRAMAKNKVLSKQIHKEALLDCYADTRVYAKRYAK